MVTVSGLYRLLAYLIGKDIKRLCLFALIVAGTASAQQEREQQHALEKERETPNKLAGFIGALTNPEAEETGPSFGADYIRELSETLGVGVIAEFARAGEREALVAGAFVVKLTPAFELVLAPGVLLEGALEDQETEEPHTESGRGVGFVARFGVAYVFEQSRFTLAPTLYVDLLESSSGGVTAHLVYGLSIGFPF